jgi:ribose 5-phosphate isomerase B
MPGGTIAVASDHAGFDLKEILKRDLEAAGLEVLGLGTRIGISMAANRNPKVRAAVVHDVTSARLSRLHNDANVVAFGQRVIGSETAREALKVFLDTEFEGGRHAGRVAKLSKGCTT